MASDRGAHRSWRNAPDACFRSLPTKLLRNRRRSRSNRDGFDVCVGTGLCVLDSLGLRSCVLRGIWPSSCPAGHVRSISVSLRNPRDQGGPTPGRRASPATRTGNQMTARALGVDIRRARNGSRASVSVRGGPPVGAPFPNEERRRSRWRIRCAWWPPVRGSGGASETCGSGRASEGPLPSTLASCMGAIDCASPFPGRPRPSLVHVSPLRKDPRPLHSVAEPGRSWCVEDCVAPKAACEEIQP